MKHAALVLLAFLLMGAANPPNVAADASKPSAPLDLYIAGRYDEAVAAGIGAHNADGLAVAARAALAKEQAGDTPCLPCLEQAEDLARRAVAADPKLPEGHIYIAMTLGYETRIVGIIQARLKGYAEQAKAELDEALKLDPDNAWALAALGGWNIEIVRNGGSVLANLIYGATLQTGLDDFAKAFKQQPDSPVLRYQYALTLSGFDLATYRHEIEDSLTRAVNGKAVSANDALIRQRAQLLLKLLHAGNDDTYLAQVRKFQGYP